MQIVESSESNGKSPIPEMDRLNIDKTAQRASGDAAPGENSAFNIDDFGEK